MPPATGVMRGLDLSLLDPADEDERQLLLLAAHPQLWEAIENGADEVLLEGQPMSPRLHLTLHKVVANQIWNDDPPDMWATAQRLTAAGYDRHEVLHMLGSVLSEDIFNAMTGKVPFDMERTRRHLAALPGSWEDLRPAVPQNRAARRTRARRRIR